MPRWDNEVMRTVVPGPDIKCATCVYRLRPVTVGNYTADRSGYSSCDKYSNKPSKILWENADCPHYKKDPTITKL